MGHHFHAVVALALCIPWAFDARADGLSAASCEAAEGCQEANLERVGDEAEKMARMVRSIIASGGPRSLPSGELRVAADMASDLLRKALDAFARLDTAAAVSILKEDNLIDREFDGFVRKLITYMMEDPRMISPSLDLLFLAKAIERIGDHAKNIAEFIIYVVKGADIRHTSMEQIESVVR